MDYILLCQRPRAEIEAALRPNPNEVVATRWLSQAQCADFVGDGKDKGDITPP